MTHLYGSTDSETSEDTTVGSPSPAQTMSPSLFLMTTLFETALSLAHQRQPSAEIEWVSKLEDYFVRASANIASVSDDEMNGLLDTFSSVSRDQWRQAIRRMTTQPSQKRSVEPSRVWEGWVWGSISKVVCRELGDVVARAETQNIIIEYVSLEFV